MRMWLMVALVAVIAACGGNGGDDTPRPSSDVPTPDVPTLSARVAIGLASNTCHDPYFADAIRVGAKAVYQGKGVWQVFFSAAYDSPRWEVYEANNLAVPIGLSHWHAGWRTSCVPGAY